MFYLFNVLFLYCERTYNIKNENYDIKAIGVQGAVFIHYLTFVRNSIYIMYQNMFVGDWEIGRLKIQTTYDIYDFYFLLIGNEM